MLTLRAALALPIAVLAVACSGADDAGDATQTDVLGLPACVCGDDSVECRPCTESDEWCPEEGENLVMACQSDTHCLREQEVETPLGACNTVDGHPQRTSCDPGRDECNTAAECAETLPDCAPAKLRCAHLVWMCGNFDAGWNVCSCE